MNAWCTAVQAPLPTATSPAAVASSAGSNSGASTTHTKHQARLVDQAARAGRSRAGRRRAAPALDFDRAGGEEDAVARLRRRRGRRGRPAPRRRGSWRPVRRARRPPAPARRPARGRPRCLAHSCQASSCLRGCEAPPGMTTAPTYGAWKTRNGVSAKYVGAVDELLAHPQVGLVGAVAAPSPRRR